MVDAVSNTSLAALKARAFAGREAMLQARPAPRSAPPSQPVPGAVAASPYKRGSVQSENVQMATGMAKAARTNIETLNMGVNSYNGAARMLADTDRIEDLRRRGGDKIVDLFVKAHRQIQTSALMLINSSSERMVKEFTVTGTPLSRAQDGSYKVGRVLSVQC